MRAPDFRPTEGASPPRSDATRPLGTRPQLKGAAVKGWCPGALRPMESGDGLIVRLKLTGGIVDVRWRERIAALVDAVGATVRSTYPVEATCSCAGFRRSTCRRCTMRWREPAARQQRGGRSRSQRHLQPAGWARSGRGAGYSADRKNPRAAPRDDASLHRLPGKFGFAVDDGGVLGLARVPADIRFVACHTSDGPVFTVDLAGAPRDSSWALPSETRCVTSRPRSPARFCAFSGTSSIRRMRDLGRRARCRSDRA